MGVSTITTINLLAKLQEVPDVRRRQGRLYPLASVLGMLILAALNGESSLRGMLGWGERHWRELARPLGFKVGTSAPVYGTVWRILHLLPLATLESVLGAWLATDAVAGEVAVALDGKQLRGSKRRESELPALHVVTAAAQGLGVVLGQALAEHQDDVAATLALLECLPIQGKVVTLDAGLLTREVAQTILEKGGAYLGLLKGNHGEVTSAVAYWLEVQLGTAPPDYVEMDKRHGRVEKREYWWTASAELEAYLAQEYGWEGVRLCGRVRRQRRPLTADEWTECEEYVAVYGSRCSHLPTAPQCSQWLRGHWCIENRVFWVLDVTYGEDRNPARGIGVALSQLRCISLNVMRRLGYRYVPDGHRAAAAQPDRGLAWLRSV